jgi:predicted transcriptional regulator
MARKETLNERAARLSRPVLLQVELRAATLAEVDELARHFGQTRADAIEAAVGEWTWRWRKKHTRRDRLDVERTIRESRDEVPLGPLLARFRAQMEAASSANSDIGFPSVLRRASVSRMDTNRQVKAELDAEFYDRIADIAKGDDRSIAYLIRKGLEKVAAEHDAQESDVEAVA